MYEFWVRNTGTGEEVIFAERDLEIGLDIWGMTEAYKDGKVEALWGSGSGRRVNNTQ